MEVERVVTQENVGDLRHVLILREVTRQKTHVVLRPHYCTLRYQVLVDHLEDELEDPILKTVTIPGVMEPLLLYTVPLSCTREQGSGFMGPGFLFMGCTSQRVKNRMQGPRPTCVVQVDEYTHTTYLGPGRPIRTRVLIVDSSHPPLPSCSPPFSCRNRGGIWP